MNQVLRGGFTHHDYSGKEAAKYSADIETETQEIAMEVSIMSLLKLCRC